MSPVFVWSQVLVALAFIVQLISFHFKSGRKFRILFVIASILNGTHFILLGSIPAALIIYISGLRWFTTIFSKRNYLMYIFILLGIISVFTTSQTWIGIFPLISGTMGTIAAFQKNESRTRLILMVATVSWIAYNIIVLTPVGIVAETTYFISNLIGFYYLYYKKT